MTTDIDQDTMAEIKSSEQTWVVDFGADWCGPCKKMEPIYEEVSASFDSVEFGKVDMEEQSDLATEFNVRALPTLLVLQGGDVKARTQGFMNEDDLEEWVEENA
jgi:Thioredoxin domain-containing protein